MTANYVKYAGLLTFCLIFLTASRVSAQPLVQVDSIANTSYAKAVQTAKFMVDTLMQSQNIPGIQVAVAVEGKTVWSEGIGYSDLEFRTPMLPSTKLRIGSVSKTLTATALGVLVEEGKLDLDAPVQNYVPYFPEKKYPISTRQVAGHIAGIRHYRGDEFLSAINYPNVQDQMRIFKNDSLEFEPGTKYLYSSYGWNLVSAVIEGASKKPFLNYMFEEVLEPLQMNHTVPDKVSPIIAQRTSYYEKNENGELFNAPYVDNSNKWAGGGYLGTMEDLLIFGEAMQKFSFLKESTIKLLWESQKTTDGKKTNYGIGWFEGESEQGNYWVGHSGGSVGGTTQFIIYPEAEIIVAISGNLSGIKYHDIHLKIGDLFAD